MGLSLGCRVKHDLPRDHAITYDDVERPSGGAATALRQEQDALFFPRHTPGPPAE
jgi:predicted homoserine dehydrogenase-like protein